MACLLATAVSWVHAMREVIRWHACWQRRSLGCISELECRTLLCGAKQRPVGARGGAHRLRRLLKRRLGAPQPRQLRIALRCLARSA